MISPQPELALGYHLFSLSLVTNYGGLGSWAGLWLLTTCALPT